MKILEQLNKFKQFLKTIELASDTLPEEIQQDFKDEIKKARDSINAAGGLVEKYFQDEETFDRMQEDLRRRMAEIPIYEGVNDTVKEAIIDKVIRSKDLNLLTEEQLQDFIKDRLETSSLDDLIRKSYSKYDILKLGEAVEESPGVSESKKYESGMQVLRGLVATPKGREEAIAHGIEKLMKNISSRRYYMALYYGLTKV